MHIEFNSEKLMVNSKICSNLKIQEFIPSDVIIITVNQALPVLVERINLFVSKIPSLTLLNEDVLEFEKDDGTKYEGYVQRYLYEDSRHKLLFERIYDYEKCDPHVPSKKLNKLGNYLRNH